MPNYSFAAWPKNANPIQTSFGAMGSRHYHEQTHLSRVVVDHPDHGLHSPLLLQQLQARGIWVGGVA